MVADLLYLTRGRRGRRTARRRGGRLIFNRLINGFLDACHVLLALLPLTVPGQKNAGAKRQEDKQQKTGTFFHNRIIHKIQAMITSPVPAQIKTMFLTMPGLDSSFVPMD